MDRLNYEDILNGDNFSNILDGLGGNDMLYGQAGDDTIKGCERRSNYPSLKRPGIPVAPE